MRDDSENNLALKRGDRVKHPETSEKFAQRLLTVKEAGSCLALGPWRVRSMIYRGELPYLRLGRRILLDLKDLDSLVEAKKQRECCTRSNLKEV